MNFIKRFFKTKIWVVKMQIRIKNKTVHTFPITVECRWKWRAKERAINEIELVAGDTFKLKSFGKHNSNQKK